MCSVNLSDIKNRLMINDGKKRASVIHMNAPPFQWLFQPHTATPNAKDAANEPRKRSLAMISNAGPVKLLATIVVLPC